MNVEQACKHIEELGYVVIEGLLDKDEATLLDALEKAKAADKHLDLVRETEQWLDSLGMDADLDAWRLEMARRTEALLKP